MKLFISWSGDFSREVAEKLSIWIPCMIQSITPFYSPDDIGKGENWNTRLSEELEKCNFGIVCLTPENVAAPWIHFEAGALSKKMGSARLSSLMLGIRASDVKGPLSRFQNTKFERNDFFKLAQAINKATDQPLSDQVLQRSFDNIWPQMESDITQIVKKYETPQDTKDTEKSDSEAIQEILQIVRKIDTKRSPSSSHKKKNAMRKSYNSPHLNTLQLHIPDDDDLLLLRPTFQSETSYEAPLSSQARHFGYDSLDARQPADLDEC